MATVTKTNIATGESNQISILEANGGVARELVEREFEQVMKNVLDINTDPKTKRSITLKITFAPSADRSMMSSTISVSSKLAAACPVDFSLLIGGSEKEPVVMETTNEVPGQTDFEGNEAEEQKVIKFSAMA